MKIGIIKKNNKGFYLNVDNNFALIDINKRNNKVVKEGDKVVVEEVRKIKDRRGVSIPVYKVLKIATEGDIVDTKVTEIFQNVFIEFHIIKENSIERIASSDIEKPQIKELLNKLPVSKRDQLVKEFHERVKKIEEEIRKQKEENQVDIEELKQKSYKLIDKLIAQVENDQLRVEKRTLQESDIVPFQSDDDGIIVYYKFVDEDLSDLSWIFMDIQDFYGFEPGELLINWWSREFIDENGNVNKDSLISELNRLRNWIETRE